MLVRNLSSRFVIFNSNFQARRISDSWDMHRGCDFHSSSDGAEGTDRIWVNNSQYLAANPCSSLGLSYIANICKFDDMFCKTKLTIKKNIIQFEFIIPLEIHDI